MDSRINMEPAGVQLSEPVDVEETKYNPNRTQTWREWAGEKIQWVRNNPTEALVLGATGATALIGTTAVAIPNMATACQNTGQVSAKTMDNLLRILSSKIVGERPDLAPKPSSPPPTTSAPATTASTTLTATLSTTACPACPTVSCSAPTTPSNTTSSNSTTPASNSTTTAAAAAPTTVSTVTNATANATTSTTTTPVPTTTVSTPEPYSPRPVNETDHKLFELPKLTPDEGTYLLLQRLKILNVTTECQDTYAEMFKNFNETSGATDDLIKLLGISDSIFMSENLPPSGMLDSSQGSYSKGKALPTSHPFEILTSHLSDSSSFISNEIDYIFGTGHDTRVLNVANHEDLAKHSDLSTILGRIKSDLRKLELMDSAIRNIREFRINGNMTEADPLFPHKANLIEMFNCAQFRALEKLANSFEGKTSLNINGVQLTKKDVYKILEASIQFPTVCSTVSITTAVASTMLAGVSTLAFGSMLYKVSRTKEEPREQGTAEENIPLNPVGQQNQPEPAGQAEPVNAPEEPQAPVQAEAQAEPQPEPQAEPQGAEARPATPVQPQQPPEMVGELMELNTSTVKAFRRGEALSAEDQEALDEGTAFNLAPAEGETHGKYRERLYNQIMQLAILERRTNGDNKGTVITFLGHIYKMRDHLNGVSGQYPFGDFAVDCAIKHVESMYQHGKLSERELQTLCEHYTYNLVDGYLEEKGEFEILKEFWASAYDYGEENAYKFINYMIGDRKA